MAVFLQPGADPLQCPDCRAILVWNGDKHVCPACVKKSEYKGWHGEHTQAVIDLHDAIVVELNNRGHKASISYCFSTLPTLGVEGGEYGIEVFHDLRWTEATPATKLLNIDGKMVTHDEIPSKLIIDWWLDNWTDHVYCEDHSIEIEVKTCAYFDRPVTYHADSIERLLKYEDWLEASEKVEH